MTRHARAVQLPETAPDPSDASLVERVRLGDTQAFELIFRRHYESLWRFAIGYVSSPDVARDLVHDLFSHIWERRHDWAVQGSVAPYLFRATRNRALNHLRHERTVLKWREDAAQATSEDAVESATLRQVERGPVEAMIAADDATVLRRAVATLPERQRQALVLRWFDGLTNPEVAAVLCVSVKAVESLLIRAFAALRQSLGPTR
jgi:RNA polymerase sigma-70 factor (ECF subfamily)